MMREAEKFVEGAGSALKAGRAEAKTMEGRALDSPMPTTLDDGFRAEMVARAQEGAYLTAKNSAWFNSSLSDFSNALKGVHGLEKNYRIMAGNSLQAGRGAYAEILRAVRQERKGEPVHAIGQGIGVPGWGRTDVDILTKEGRAIENKHVRDGISCDDAFKSKIDKLAGAVEEGISVHGVKIRSATFANSGPISPEAIRYGEARGILMKPNLKHSQPA